MELSGAWDRYHPRLLGKQPCEGDLSRCRLLSFRDAVEQIDQGLIRLERLGREARQGAAKVRAIELRIFVDLAREEALAQRAVGDEADPEFLLMYSGRLFRPRCSSLGPKSKPNLVAITTLARKGPTLRPPQSHL